MPKGKRKVKKIGLVERILNKCGYVRAPKKRAGKVAVKPYNRKAPAKATDVVITNNVTGEQIAFPA
jgi:hypothetical protein